MFTNAIADLKPLKRKRFVIDAPSRSQPSSVASAAPSAGSSRSCSLSGRAGSATDELVDAQAVDPDRALAEAEHLCANGRIANRACRRLSDEDTVDKEAVPARGDPYRDGES